MNLLKDDIKSIYFKYLTAAFGSSLVASIYSLVDSAVVGQYEGPAGTAALAVVAPIFNIIYSFGLLTGIGASIMFSTERGNGKQKRADEFFSVSLISNLILALLCWIILILFDEQILRLFGAGEDILPLAKSYMVPIKFVVPVFTFIHYLSAFLRNDNNPQLATFAVLAGGVVNIIGDIVLVFTFDMGIIGAGIATAIGAVITVGMMLTHFISRKNTIRFVKVQNIPNKIRVMSVTGFATFFVDIAMGFVTILFNRQIMKYAGTDALAVYGVIVNISTFVQATSYGTGQAAQPIISMNYGAKQWKRISGTLKYGLFSTAFLSVLWTVVAFAVPSMFIRLFMNPTESVLAIAPPIIRSYSISFLLLPLNIFSTYYFQAIMKPGASFIVSVGRGLVLSGGLIIILPALFGTDAMWFAMPITESVIAAYVIICMVRYTKPFLLKEEQTVK